jgi:uncharacterized membrane-anchored protein YitT (DUF2179 family)
MDFGQRPAGMMEECIGEPFVFSFLAFLNIPFFIFVWLSVTHMRINRQNIAIISQSHAIRDGTSG